MNTPLTSTITVFELLWTVLAIVGVGVHAASARESRKDVLLARESRKNGGSLLMAKDCFRTEWIEGMVQAIFVLVGVRAMMLPSPPSSVSSPAGQAIFAVLIMGAEAALIVNSMLRRNTRTTVITMLEDGIR